MYTRIITVLLISFVTIMRILDHMKDVNDDTGFDSWLEAKKGIGSVKYNLVIDWS